MSFTPKSKHSTTSSLSMESLVKKTAPTSADRDLSQRPIASNSRVRRDEKVKQDMYLSFVNNALAQKAQGNSTPYDELLHQFQFQFPSPAQGPTQLRLWITSLTHVVSRLDKSHLSLVDAILALPWTTTADVPFVNSYISFVGALVSARPEYLALALDRSVQGLTYQSGLQLLSLSSSHLPSTTTTTSSSSSPPLTRRTIYNRIHSLLQHLLSLIPTLPPTLQPLLVKHFPHKRLNQLSQVTYTKNLLKVSDYCPALTDRILSLVVDRAIQIDVEIQVELDDLESDGTGVGPNSTTTTGDEGVFDFDILLAHEPSSNPGSGSDSDSDDDDDDEDLAFSDISSEAGEDHDALLGPGSRRPEPELPANMKRVREMVTKLDSILKILFDHFSGMKVLACGGEEQHEEGSSSSSSSPPPPLPAHLLTHFLTLLSIFDRTVLRTFKSRYTQFLLFWYSSLHPSLSDLFQGFLLSKALLEESQPAVTRAAAASYVASFVSRARFVEGEGVRGVVRLMCGNLGTRIRMEMGRAREGGGEGGDGSLNTVFYAVAQAVFLVFCFRWRDLLVEDDDEGEGEDLVVNLGGGGGGRRWIPELDVIKNLITSPMNPLKHCSSNVVQQFARVAQHVGFMYCYPILEANRRGEYFGFSHPHHENSSSTPTSSLFPHTPTPSGIPTPTTSMTSYSSPAPGLALGTILDAGLTTFFPFDPYRLPKSSGYVQGIYREWGEVAVGDDDDDDDDDDDEEGEEEEKNEADNEEGGEEGIEEDEDYEYGEPVPGQFSRAHPSRSQSRDVLGIGESFGGMSISPVAPIRLSVQT